MKIKIYTISVLTFLLNGCMSSGPAITIDNTGTSLAEASYSVSRSIVSLSETAQAAHPTAVYPPPMNAKQIGMDQITSIDWSGPVEPLVKQLAKASHYSLVILGKPPAIPVLVTVYDKNRVLADVLRDVAYQSGERATIAVYPRSRTIELRYAKN